MNIATYIVIGIAVALIFVSFIFTGAATGIQEKINLNLSGHNFSHIPVYAFKCPCCNHEEIHFLTEKGIDSLRCPEHKVRLKRERKIED